MIEVLVLVGVLGVVLAPAAVVGWQAWTARLIREQRDRPRWPRRLVVPLPRRPT